MTRRRPAAATRVLLGGGSAAVTLGIVAALGMSGPQPATQVLPDGPLRVVITDARIEPATAVAAAREAAASGDSLVQVPVAGAAVPAPRGSSDVPHTTTRGS